MNIPDEKQTPFQRVLNVLEEKQLKKQWLWSELKIESQYWNNWKNRGIPANKYAQIADLLNLRLDWLVKGVGEKYKTLEEINGELAPALGHIRHVPVVGKAQLGDNGHWCEIDYPPGHGDGYITYPSKDDEAYAIRCIGDSMRPRIKNGEFVIVEPKTTPISGDEVIVKSKDGRVMVKTLLYERDGRVYLQSVNETYPSISIAEEEIEKMHFVAAIVKSILWQKDA